MAYFTHPDLGLMLRHLFPDLQPGVDYIVQDDGKGPYLKEWNTTVTRPKLKASMDKFLENKTKEKFQVSHTRASQMPTLKSQVEVIMKILKTMNIDDPEFQAIDAQIQQVKTNNPYPEDN